MPKTRVSKETFDFLGLSSTAAQRRFQLAEQMQAYSPDCCGGANNQGRLEDLMEEFPDRIGLGYEEYFEQYRIRQELRDAIMDPEFSDVRGTAGPGYWVRDALRGRLQVLEEYWVGQHFRRNLPPLAPVAMPSQHEGRSRNAGEGDFLLYKGVSSWRTRENVNSGRDEEPPCRISMAFLAQHEPERADFTREHDGLYFTPQKELALRFAAFATRLTYGIPSSRLLTIRVPRSFVDAFRHEEIWVDRPRDAWRKAVQLSRYSCLFDRRKWPLPPKLTAMLDKCDFLIGNVSTHHERAPVLAERARACYKEIGVENVLHVTMADGTQQVGVQWMFKRRVLDSLEEAIGREGTDHVALAAPSEESYGRNAYRAERKDSAFVTAEVEDTHSDDSEEAPWREFSC